MEGRNDAFGLEEGLAYIRLEDKTVFVELKERPFHT